MLDGGLHIGNRAGKIRLDRCSQLLIFREQVRRAPVVNDGDIVEVVDDTVFLGQRVSAGAGQTKKSRCGRHRKGNGSIEGLPSSPIPSALLGRPLACVMNLRGVSLSFASGLYPHSY